MMRYAIALLFSVLLAAASADAAVIVSPQYKWPNAEIPYDYVGVNAKEEALVELAIQRWQAVLPQPMFRRRQLGDRYSVTFIPSQGLPSGVCMASRAGFDANTKEVFVQIQESCSIKIIIHELGHVIGLEHEHQRCDAEKYVTLSYATWVELGILEDEARRVGSTSVMAKQFPPFQCVPELNRGGAITVPGPYDYLSVMHYEPLLPLGCLASVKSCLVFRLKDEGKRIFGGPGLDPDREWHLTRNGANCVNNSRCISPQDAAAVRKLYGF